MKTGRHGRDDSSVAETLRSREVELLDAMVEGSQDGLWILTPAGVVLDGNHIAHELAGVRPEAVIARPVEELRHAPGLDGSIVSEVARKRVAVTTIETLPDARRLQVSGRLIAGPDGSARYVVLTVRDITEMSRLMTRFQETTRLSDRYRTELRDAEMREVQASRLVIRSEVMRAASALAVRYAAVDSPVLILGETGSGKGVFAKLIHQASGRRAGPFLEVNCGAIPEGLIEAELFGYVRGAFTGADARGKVGLVELAQAGTLLLNEIGDLPLALQVKLLRFLEDGEIWPVGGVRGRRPDVRIIAATNRDLDGMIARGLFRRDLYYRLNVLTLRVPPLREHPEDVPWLVEMMVAQLEKRLHRRPRVTPAAVAHLAQYSYPGNVRELWNLVERLVVTVSADTIDVPDLPPEVAESARHRPARGGVLRQTLQRVELSILREALERYGTQVLAARYLGVGQATVARKAKLYGLR